MGSIPIEAQTNHGTGPEQPASIDQARASMRNVYIEFAQDNEWKT